MEEGLKIIRRINYPSSNRRWAMLQDYSMQPYTVLLCLYAAILYVIIARHAPILWPGIGGAFAVTLLANLLGLLNSRRHYLEAGLTPGYFYIGTGYDLIFKKEIPYYPFEFSNAQFQGADIYINYKGENIKLKREDWPEWELLEYYFRHGQLE